MRRILLGIALGLPAALAATAPAHAAEMIDSSFHVTYRYAGVDQTIDDTVVPLLPNNACFRWFVRLSDPKATPAIVEKLELSAAPTTWRTDAAKAEGDTTAISDDGKLATTTLLVKPDADGWISNGWCIAEGDPLGADRIEITADGILLTTFDFDVVAPEAYTWPSIRQPEPHERSVDNSW